MTKRSIIQTVVVSAVVGVLGAGLLVPAVAQDAPEDTATSEETTDPVTRREERRAEFATALAEELGLDADTVAAAIETVREDLHEAHRAERLEALEQRLADAVAAGELTQEQADALLAAHEAGISPFGGPRGHHGRGPGGAGFGGPSA